MIPRTSRGEEKGNMTTRTKRKLGAALTLVGLVVMLLPVMASATTPPTNSNEVGYWCADGIKVEPIDALTFTVPAPPEGYVWTKLILKAGNTGTSVDEENFVILNPVVGQAYSWQGTWQGQVISKNISHVILCKELVTTTTPPDDDETTTSTSVVETTTTTQATTTTSEATTTTPPENTSSSIETTTTTIGSTTTTGPSGSTLPFTGADSGTLVGMGASALALGALLLFAVRREEI